MNKRWLTVTTLITASALLAAGCRATPASDGDSVIRVVASTSIWGDVVREVVGEDANVEVIIGNGVDPHDFQLSAQQIGSVRSADLVVVNGLGLEASFGDALDAAETDGVAVLALGPLVDPRMFDSRTFDPHIWQDPQRVIVAVWEIVAALNSLHPSDQWEANATEYVRAIQRTDSEIETLLAELPDSDRKLVTNHDAFGYFADRYGFEIIATVIPGDSTLIESSAADLVDLIELLQENSVAAIFVENTGSTELADTIAAELDRPIAVRSLTSDALGEPGSSTDTYLGMMLQNARVIVDVLGGGT